MSSDAPPSRRGRLAWLAFVVVTLLVGLELAAEPIVSWRTQQALAGCGVRHARVDLGRRPHLAGIVRGRVDAVTLTIAGYELGPLLVERVDVTADQVAFRRRRLLGLASPLELTHAVATATITEDALDEALDVPLTSVRITSDGVFVVLLGAPVEVRLTVEDGRLELRVDESLPGLRLEAPGDTEILDVTTENDRLVITAQLPQTLGSGAAC